MQSCGDVINENVSTASVAPFITVLKVMLCNSNQLLVLFYVVRDWFSTWVFFPI